MRYVIFGIVLILIITFGVTTVAINGRTQAIRKGQTEVTVIEGCQYFMNPSYYGYHTLTHKGNCTNNIHIYRNHE